MEVHFVHKHAETGALGVLGVFFVPGAANATFATLAATFPQKAGEQSALPNVDPTVYCHVTQEPDKRCANWLRLRLRLVCSLCF